MSSKAEIVTGLIVVPVFVVFVFVHDLDQTCMSRVTKPIGVPLLFSVTFIAATDVPMELVLIHKSPVIGSHVAVPVGKGSN